MPRIVELLKLKTLDSLVSSHFLTENQIRLIISDIEVAERRKHLNDLKESDWDKLMKEKPK